MITSLIGGTALSKIPWKWVGIGAAVVYIGWLKLSVANLETTVAEQETEIVDLKGSVSSQNNAIEQWRLIAGAKQAEANAALLEAQKEGERVERVIKRLETSNASTCEEGIQLIDEVLGL